MSLTAERQARIARLRALPEQIAALVAPLSAADLVAHFLAGEWSVAQNVHHLVDSHMNAYIRCRLILTEDQPTLKPYNQDDWAALADAAAADVAPSLAILRGMHERWASFFENLPDGAWDRAGMHPEYGIVTLDSLLASYANHGEAHIDQITRTLAAKA